MNFLNALLALLTVCVIKKTYFDGTVKASGQKPLYNILQESCNITYFEPAGYKRDSIIEQHKEACRRPTHSAVVIELFAFQRLFTLIAHQDIDLFDKDVVITTQAKHHGTSRVNISLNEYYHGKVAGDPLSYLTLRLHNGFIDGLYYTQGEAYYVEPASRYFYQPVPFHSLVYKSTDVNFNLSTVKTKGHRVNSHFIAKLSQHQQRHITKTLNKTTANTCALHIAADHHLFKKFGKESIEDTIAEMVFHIGQADKIFRATDFDGEDSSGDNIGFTIASITVFQDDSSEDSFIALSTNDITELLVSWSSLNHDAFCLSVLFTYQDFTNGVLGLAWVGDLTNGGICSKKVIPQNSTEAINFNTAVLTLLNGKSKVPRKASIVTITHELGHGFGATHDPKECRPGGDVGNYIMHETATQGDKPNNYFFSKCSKTEMWAVIYNKGPQCFIGHQKGIYCGNKIVEEGEDCDCGYPHECETTDPCCDHGNMTSGVPSCKVKHGYQCSPLKGPCCNKSCNFITSHDTVCQKETECTFHSICNLSSATCPPAILKPMNTTCNHGSNTCFHGDCTGPICSAYDMEQCECTEYDSLCHVCCQHEEKGCIPSSYLTGKDIYQFVGSLCNNKAGYCDEYGQCIIVDTDNHYTMFIEAFKRLTSKAMIRRFTIWANENWCPMLVLWSIILVVMVMLKCYPIVLLRQLIRRYLLIEPEPTIPFNNITGHTDNVQTVTDDEQTDSGT